MGEISAWLAWSFGKYDFCKATIEAVEKDGFRVLLPG
jgi:hypothetical protein